MSTETAQRLAQRSLQTYLIEGLRCELAIALASIGESKGAHVAETLSARVDRGDFSVGLSEEGTVRFAVDGETLFERPMWELRVPTEFGLGDA